ncbi:hypothetical protein EHS25_002202 [Saitozyma podzolica]|uniref:Apple domain-containing protein n=1 Tax=Saitozyma podzolica TaxID=1890683 RepID=A0A427YEQ7_9TREE|nr:hypothetical protein EHS25_002202 [Saitozyma podzolica]
MFQTPLLALCTLLLASGALSTESPQPRTGLKQATRDSIVRQQDLRNRGFRRQVPTTGTYPTCPNFSTGTVNHAVYPDTAAVTGTVYSTTQSDLQSCILTCCASPTCLTASWDPTGHQCNIYTSTGPSSVSYTAGSLDVIVNGVDCAGNAANAGTWACCNAPLSPPPP